MDPGDFMRHDYEAMNAIVGLVAMLAISTRRVGDWFVLR